MRVLAAIAVLSAIAAQSPPKEDVTGIWRGQSICGPSLPACTNETVVYDIRAIAGKPDVVLIRADKIVNGQTVTMGTGEWKHDAARHVLIWEQPSRTWLLTIKGSTIDGTLTGADKTVVRRMTLKKDP